MSKDNIHLPPPPTAPKPRTFRVTWTHSGSTEYQWMTKSSRDGNLLFLADPDGNEVVINLDLAKTVDIFDSVNNDFG